MTSLNGLFAESNSTLRDVLILITSNERGICFIVDKMKMVGVVTDGDIRRALLKNVGLDSPIKNAMRKNFISLPVDSSVQDMRKAFHPSLKLIPLCDANGLLVDVVDATKNHRIPILEPELSGKESEYVSDCLTTNWISSQGSYVNRFEKMFEDMHLGLHAVAVSNGTTALHLALMSLDIGPGDEVIVPNLTFAATINSVLHCQATPVICEVDPVTWCIDPRQIMKLLTPKTKAMIPVHLYGQSSNMMELCKIAANHNLLVIEDCAEALGSKANNQLVGTFGNAATFSFFGNKTISTGEGGMVLFKSQDDAKKAKILRDHGMTPGKRYWHEMVGYNYRMTNIQAAIGVAQMERFSQILDKKLRIASFYSQELFGAVGINQLPSTLPGELHSNWLYTLLVSDEINRDKLIERLLTYGIEARPVFYPLSQMPPYLGYQTSHNLDIGIHISQKGISLPSSVGLRDHEMIYVAKTLKKLLKNNLA